MTKAEQSRRLAEAVSLILGRIQSKYKTQALFVYFDDRVGVSMGLSKWRWAIKPLHEILFNNPEAASPDLVATYNPKYLTYSRLYRDIKKHMKRYSCE